MATKIEKPRKTGIVKVAKAKCGGYCVLSAEPVKGYANLVQYVVAFKGGKIATFDWETAVSDFERKAVAA